MSRVFVAAAATAFITGSAIGLFGQQSTAAQYDEFMRLPANERPAHFASIDARDKAVIVRTHAERWLAKNRARLDPSQVRVFQEAIAFITPELYLRPLDAQMMKREQDLKNRARCTVDPVDLAAAFDVLGRSASPAATARWSYLTRAQCWIGWFAESVVGYIPGLPPSGR